MPPAFTAAEREAVVARVLAALRERYGERLRAVALEGSTAKGLAAPRSDVEFRVLLEPVERRSWRTAFVDGMFVGLGFASPAQALRRARSVDYLWPVAGDVLVTSRVLYDPGGLYPGLRQAALRAEARADFASLVEDALADMYEHVLKLFSLADDALALTAEAREVAFWAAIAVALGARHRYASSRTMYEESLCLGCTPPGFGVALPVLLSPTVDPAALRGAVGVLWPALRTWAAGLGRVWGEGV